MKQGIKRKRSQQSCSPTRKRSRKQTQKIKKKKHTCKETQENKRRQIQNRIKEVVKGKV